jgi:hypothetical protein
MQRENLFSKLIKKSQTRRKLKFATKKTQEEITHEVENHLQMVTIYIITHPINQKPMWDPTKLTRDRNPMQTTSRAPGMSQKRNSYEQIDLIANGPPKHLTITEFDRFEKKNLVKERSRSQPQESSTLQTGPSQQRQRSRVFLGNSNFNEQFLINETDAMAMCQ